MIGGTEGCALGGAAGAGWEAASTARRAARTLAATRCILATAGRQAAAVEAEARRIMAASPRRSSRSCAYSGPETLVNHVLRYCSGQSSERELALPVHSDGAGCRSMRRFSLAVRLGPFWRSLDNISARIERAR